MRLIRHGEPGREEPGVLLDDGRRIDASGEFRDYDEAFFATNGVEALREWVAQGCPDGVEVPADVRWGAPVARPSKLVCVGKNYLDHAKEFGEGIPAEPVLFMKATTAWSGPFDEVANPPDAVKLDYEVELGVVIGSVTTRVGVEGALDRVAGYLVFCDYSERAFQKEHAGQWVKGKSCDTFAPAGPALVTADEVPDPQSLRLWTKVNGEMRQNGWTGEMMVPVARLVSYISGFMTLLPGDVVATGTPGGVGMGWDPPTFLRPGDCVELGIEKIGVIRQRIVNIRDS
jgi:2-keto-4-pentenoate hydratase/2-oxohepta-3-ene-1,7-dioic acid hydratase in catechol pathway